MLNFKKLLIILKQKGISLTKLRTELGISSATVAKISKNESISLETLVKICNYLNVQLDDVITIDKNFVASPLLARLLDEMNNNIKNGIYHATQIFMTYNSNHIEGSKLTNEQTRYIYETSTILSSNNEITKVDDIIETVNHFACIKYVLQHVFDPLSESLIKQLHKILKTGTSDSFKSWFKVGEYKILENEVGGKQTSTVEQTKSDILNLVANYNKKDKINFNDIVDFHYCFEIIHPFQDGNGRVGRLIAFKECLKNNIIPFVIDEELKLFYYRGLDKYKNEKGYLLETCKAGQEKYNKLIQRFKIS